MKSKSGNEMTKQLNKIYSDYNFLQSFSYVGPHTPSPGWPKESITCHSFPRACVNSWQQSGISKLPTYKLAEIKWKIKEKATEKDLIIPDEDVEELTLFNEAMYLKLSVKNKNFQLTLALTVKIYVKY